MKYNNKKVLKIVYFILCIKLMLLAISIYAEEKMNDLYILHYEDLTLKEQREMLKRNDWKEVGFEHGNILVDAPGVSEGAAGGMCKIQFWEDRTGDKQILNQTIHNPICPPLREQYFKDHPVLVYIITGRGIFKINEKDDRILVVFFTIY